MPAGKEYQCGATAQAVSRTVGFGVGALPPSVHTLAAHITRNPVARVKPSLTEFTGEHSFVVHEPLKLREWVVQWGGKYKW